MINSTRRSAIVAALALVACAAAAIGANAQGSAPAAPAAEALPDLVLGNHDATVVIEEYASLTCGHCGAFHTNVLPHLKATWIDTGKVRFIYRDFPLDELAIGAAMFARCGGEAKREALLSHLYATQKVWLAENANPLDEFIKTGRQMGLPQATIEACLADEKMFNAILAEREAADKKHTIEGTPTFIINGRKFEGRADAAGFDAALKALVK